MLNGLLVESVSPSGQAFRAGIQVGDILVSYNDILLETTEILTYRASKSTNDANKIELIRRYDFRTIITGKGDLGISVIVRQLSDKDLVIAGKHDVVEQRKQELVDRAKSIIITTAPSVDGFRVIETIEIISAECVYGMTIFKDIFADLTDAFGGRSKTYQKALKEARQTCLAELRKGAFDVNANAVIAVDLDYSEISGDGKSMLLIVATGTAVKIEALS